MEYHLSQAGKDRLARIANRNALPLFAALESLLLFADLGEWRLEDGLKVPGEPTLEERRQIPLASLTISTRLSNALCALDYTSPHGSGKGHRATVADLAALPFSEYLRARNLGKKSLQEWNECLVKFGYPPLPI